MRRIYKALQQAKDEGIKDIVILDPYSVPLAVLEKSGKVLMVPDPYGWDGWINAWTCIYFGCKTIRSTKDPGEVNVHW